MIDMFLYMEKSGVPIYQYQNKESNLDQNLIGGFISAINTFSDSMEGGGLSKIEMQKKKLILRHENKDRISVLLADADIDLSFSSHCLNTMVEEFHSFINSKKLDLNSLEKSQYFDFNDTAKKLLCQWSDDEKKLKFSRNLIESDSHKLIEKLIEDICPYCGTSYQYQLSIFLNPNGLNAVIIKPHQSCGSFLLLIDGNGEIRATQSIDAEMGEISHINNQKDIDNYIQLFNDQENSAEFYHVVKINDGKLSSKGTITSSKVIYHKLLRSIFFQEWLKLFYGNNQTFAYFFYNDLVIVTINLYDMMVFTIGIPTNQFDTTVHWTGFPEVVEFLKSKAVSLGEKILC
jgi:hypothetical protein